MSVNKERFKFGRILIATCLIASLSSVSGCRDKTQPQPDTSGYPSEVADIILTRCATTGCHNSANAANAAGIDLSSWNKMFDAGRNGNSVIPYSSDYSYLLYSINTDTNLGPVLEPTMPFNQAPLSTSEYDLIRQWILQGAPDKEGNTRFPDSPSRKKIYTSMQGCDQVAVIDAESRCIMKYVPVGADPSIIESPHMVRISPDGQYWYSVFYSGSVLQKFRTSDDQLVSTLNVGSGDWNTIIITPDGRKGFLNATIAGITAVIDLETMTETTRFSMDFPHGGFITPDGNSLYLTSQLGNFIQKVDLTTAPFYDTETIILEPGETRTTASRYDPHEMVLSNDGTKYFVSCQGSNEVRIFNTSNDSLLSILNVGAKPQEFSTSSTHPYLYVTCTEDPVATGKKGSVYVIDMNTSSVISSIYVGYQPHGIAVDDDHELVYVANLNIDPNGPAPHHISSCGGRNGYITCINQLTLQPFSIPAASGPPYVFKQEVLTAPYFVSYKK
ncbi:MAG: YncE family protein [Bacteroidota bacterium]